MRRMPKTAVFNSFGLNPVWGQRLKMTVLAQVVLHLALVIVDRLHPAEQPVFDSRLIHDGTAPFDRSRGQSDLLHPNASRRTDSLGIQSEAGVLVHLVLSTIDFRLFH